MLEICWYCNFPIDVDETTEGQAQIHKDCLLELVTGGSWDSFIARMERQRRDLYATIDQLDQYVAKREAAILATA